MQLMSPAQTAAMHHLTVTFPVRHEGPDTWLRPPDRVRNIPSDSPSYIPAMALHKDPAHS